eukprot:TRINITY_DN9760_c2_g1_i1.p1 TRINITY_DN9760_c2_g1~~TRINITY_DN9760_c2_g1_i1.p1  ORF type:complete len:112 (-),score=20.82 TRINITY_DN9760_c2_g1_i1:459-794(-)
MTRRFSSSYIWLCLLLLLGPCGSRVASAIRLKEDEDSRHDEAPADSALEGTAALDTAAKDGSDDQGRRTPKLLYITFKYWHEAQLYASCLVDDVRRREGAVLELARVRAQV